MESTTHVLSQVTHLFSSTVEPLLYDHPQNHIDPIHAAAMTDKKRGLGCRFNANLRVST